MSKEYYEDVLEEVAINKYLNMIANDYGGELADTFKEKYINKDKEINRLNNIIDELEKYIKTEAKVELYGDKTGFRTFADVNDILDKLNELKGDNK